MIYALNLTCNRDLDLADLMKETIGKNCPMDLILFTVNTDTDPDYQGFQNGAGWPQGLIKLKGIREILSKYDVTNEDFILSIDSDVCFCGSEVFDYVNPAYGIIGTQHQQPYNSEFGKFGHMSGALIFLRGDIARKIANLSDQELDHLRFNHFKKHNITENEDVMLSYFAKYVGAESFDLGSVPGLSSGDFEDDLKHQYINWIHHSKDMKSFYHLNYCPTSFLDEPVTGKWDVPKVLKQKGIEL